MKRERRHELHTNLLATWLAQTIEIVKPRANTILAVGLLVVVVLAAVTLWNRYSSTGNEQAWDAFNFAVEAGRGNPTVFERLTEEFARTDMAPWAAVTAADLYLQQGCEAILQDKGQANQQLQKALENYSLVLSQSQADPLREQATFGVARCYEALSGTRRAENELQKAIESYESVVKNWPQGAYAGLASRRLEELRLPETKRFYDKLAQYDPKPIFADTPGTPAQDFKLGTVPEEPAKKSGDSKAGEPSSKPPAVPKTSPPPAPKATPAASPAKAAAPAPAKTAEPAPAKSK